MLKKNNHLKRGSIYTTLHRLEKDTLVTSRTTWDQDGPRRFYTITGYGRKLAQIGKAAASVHTSYWPELLPDPVRSPS